MTVNGQPATLGQTVVESDVIRLNGQVVEQQVPALYYALNKPTGYVTSLRSTHGESTIKELVPGTWRHEEEFAGASPARKAAERA